jgi:hypothetical protein
MDNNLPLMLLVVALLAGLATLTTRGPAQHARTSDRPWPQLWHALRTHRRVLGLLLLYSLISLPLSITGWPAPGEAVVRTLPLLVGLAGVWWEVRQEACHSEAETIIDHGILAGLTVMALPALAPLSMVIGQAWQAGTLTGMAAVAVVGWALLQFAGLALGMGIVFGVFGASIAVWLTHWSSRACR